MPRVLPAVDAGISEVAERIRGGGVAAFPTETVYGLGASTLDPAALREIYRMKGRPSDNPLIAHVVDAVDAKRLVQGWDRRCARLAAAFWPGPLTLILPRGSAVPDEAVAGLPSIAVRSPMHPVARSLLYAVGGPVSAPSAMWSVATSAALFDQMVHAPSRTWATTIPSQTTAQRAAPRAMGFESVRHATAAARARITNATNLWTICTQMNVAFVGTWSSAMRRSLIAAMASGEVSGRILP